MTETRAIYLDILLSELNPEEIYVEISEKGEGYTSSLVAPDIPKAVNLALSKVEVDIDPPLEGSLQEIRDQLDALETDTFVVRVFADFTPPKVKKSKHTYAHTSYTHTSQQWNSQ